MDFRAIGNLIATDAFNEQKAQGDAYVAAHAPAPIPEPDPDAVAFALLMTKIMGTAIARHVVGYWGTVTAPPNTTAPGGLNLPIPCTVMEVDGNGLFVAVWWKSGDDALDWTILVGGVDISNEDPLPDGIADPGDVASRQVTARRHVHPLVPASMIGSKLWPAFVADVQQMAAVDAIYGGNIPVNFTEVGTGIWRRNVPGGIVPLAFDDVSPRVGMRVLDAVDGIVAGIYDLTDTGDSVVSNNTPYYVQPDGSLGLAPPTTSGSFTATIVDRLASISVITPAGVPGLESWPGRRYGVGDYPVLVTIRCRMIGEVLPDQVYTLSIELFRRTTGGVRTAYASTIGQGGSVFIPSDGGWSILAVAPQANQLPTGSTSDVFECVFTATLLAGTAVNGATFEITYGGADPQIISQFSTTSYRFATFQRSADARLTGQFINGMFVYINGGSAHHGQTWQATLPSPFELDVSSQSWAQISPPTPAPAYQLLTAVQRSFASPNTAQVSAAVSGLTGEVVIGTLTFDERTADLAGTTIPAVGAWRSHLLLSLGGDLAANTVVKAYAKGSLDDTWHLVGTTATIHSAGPGVFIAAGSFGEPGYLMGGTELLEMQFTALTDSDDGVTVALTYNDPRCYIEVPMTLGFGGTTNHQELNGRGVFLVAGNEKKYGHPMSFIEPGRVHSPCGDVITTAGGVFTARNSNSAVIQGTEDLIGIDLEATGPDPWLPGDLQWLMFADGRNVVAFQTVPSGYGAFYFEAPADPEAPTKPPTITVKGGSMMCFCWSGSYWVLATQPAFGNA